MGKKRILETFSRWDPQFKTKRVPRLYVRCACGRYYWTKQDKSTWLKAAGCSRCSPKNRGNQWTKKRSS